MFELNWALVVDFCLKFLSTKYLRKIPCRTLCIKIHFNELYETSNELPDIMRNFLISERHKKIYQERPLLTKLRLFKKTYNKPT